MIHSQILRSKIICNSCIKAFGKAKITVTNSLERESLEHKTW